MKVLVVAILLSIVSAPVVVAAEAGDPWENPNRKVQAFNDAVDKNALRPVAVGYTKVTPGFLRRGISNAFDNIATPAIALNQLLQGKPVKAISDTGRFLLNSTIGIAGLFDVASPIGLAKHQEDFGQTFGKWGVGTGAYVVLPLLGPSNVRDTVGFVFDSVVNPLRFIEPNSTRAGVGALSVVNVRANLLGVDEVVSGDRYLFFRDAYLQRRAFLVSDGFVDDDLFEDDGFGSDE